MVGSKTYNVFALLFSKRKKIVFFALSLMACIIVYHIQGERIALNDLKMYQHEVSNFQKIPHEFSNYPVVTQHFNNPLVVYNRVSKCASSTMQWLGRALSRRKQFRFVGETEPNMSMIFTEAEKTAFAERVSNLGENTMFVRHFHFFDFQKYGGANPVYINVVREPVDRFISSFYFRRFGFVKRNQPPIGTPWPMRYIPPMTKQMTLEECVFGGVEDCIKREQHKPIFTFFCDDHSSKCRELTPYSFNLAVKNAAQHYSAIGLTEDLDLTLKVFEALLPRYFQGAPQVLPLCPETTRTKSKNRKETSQEVKAILREALRIEVEFYEFVKERFYRQVDELKKLGMMK